VFTWACPSACRLRQNDRKLSNFSSPKKENQNCFRSVAGVIVDHWHKHMELRECVYVSTVRFRAICHDVTPVNFTCNSSWQVRLLRHPFSQVVNVFPLQLVIFGEFFQCCYGCHCSECWSDNQADINKQYFTITRKCFLVILYITFWEEFRCIAFFLSGLDGRLILRQIFRKWDGGVWTGLVWLRIDTGGEDL
jgi:hypothetical protein